jgi:cysteinyl-tRNA synthetase
VFLVCGTENGTVLDQELSAFREALEDDLNTPKALAVLWEVVKSSALPADKRATLLAMDEVFGLGMKEWKVEIVEIPGEVKALAEERWQARLAKNWAESDRLRDILVEKGWTMQDGADGYMVVRR